MVFRNLIFQAEVIKQRFGTVVLPHHDQQASDDENQTEHVRMLSSNMLLLNLILLTDVTFSTPTPVCVTLFLQSRPSAFLGVRWRDRAAVAPIQYNFLSPLTVRLTP